MLKAVCPYSLTVTGCVYKCCLAQPYTPPVWCPTDYTNCNNFKQKLTCDLKEQL